MRRYVLYRVLVLVIYYNVSLPRQRTSQPMCPPHLDQSQTSKPPGTLGASSRALHLPVSSHSFLLARAPVARLLDRWMHSSGAAGARGWVSLRDWLHWPGHCGNDQLKGNYQFVQVLDTFQLRNLLCVLVDSWLKKKMHDTITMRSIGLETRWLGRSGEWMHSQVAAMGQHTNFFFFLLFFLTHNHLKHTMSKKRNVCNLNSGVLMWVFG